MASGVQVSQEVITGYDEIKTSKKYKYVVFRIADDLKSIILDEDYEKVEQPQRAEDRDIPEDKAKYEAFLAKLPSDSPRYIVYDFHYDLKEGGHRSKVIFIAWCPDNTPVRKRMLHASSKDALIKKLSPDKHYQVTEISDISLEVLTEDLSKGK